MVERLHCVAAFLRHGSAGWQDSPLPDSPGRELLRQASARNLKVPKAWPGIPNSDVEYLSKTLNHLNPCEFNNKARTVGEELDLA